MERAAWVRRQVRDWSDRWAKVEANWQEEKGSVLAEYGIWIILVIIVAAAVLTPLGNQLATVFRQLCTQLGGSC